MVVGVNHVNLSTNLKNPAANTNAQVLCPVSRGTLQGPRTPSGAIGFDESCLTFFSIVGTETVLFSLVAAISNGVWGSKSVLQVL